MILVLGTVALDSVKTPFGTQQEALGGSATYASYSASFFSGVKIIAAVGADFPSKYTKVLRERNIDLGGLQQVNGHKTFRWKGKYGYDLNEAITLDTQLNVLNSFKPIIPNGYRKTPYVFLANIDPTLQAKVLDKLDPQWVILDSMNFWIDHKRKALLKVAKRVNAVVLNDAEARQLSEESSLIKAAKRLARWGLKTLIIKKGEHGALLFHNHQFFAAPAYPQESTKDPTGCGDTFAGGFIGYLAQTRKHDWQTLRRAVIAGSVMASFTVEDFSLNRLRRLTRAQITKRHKEFQKLTAF
jgi:sugar/nucleoside kinase (ribokinase family)